MLPCINNIKNDTRNEVLVAYGEFMQIWNKIIAKRHVGLLDKQINIFTTNIDNLVEDIAEQLGIEFNQGFKGQLRPTLNVSTYSNVMSKVSPLYHTEASIPTFNYLKMHGSINWKSTDDGRIMYDTSYETLKILSNDIKELSNRNLIVGFDDLNDLQRKVQQIPNIRHQSVILKKFLEHYKGLVMINPRKTKFRETVTDMYFYELMRLYSNALERNNSLLFVGGFSFADEHIAQITVRAANANPTLQIIVFAYDADQKQSISENLDRGGHSINQNILILTPDAYKATAVDDIQKKELEDLRVFDLSSINKFFFTRLSRLIY